MAALFDSGLTVLGSVESLVVNAELPVGAIIRALLVETGTGVSSVTQSQSLPAGAVVQSAAFTVAASPAGNVTIGSVAQVREGPSGSSSLVVDFGGLRTVDRVAAPVSIVSVTPWAGTQFASSAVGGESAIVEFTEVQTERLLLVLGGSLSADALAAQGSVRVLSRPADLEVLVDGKRAWFQPGPAKPGGSTTDPAAFQATVDLATPFRAAVGAAPAGASTVAIGVELRSSVPGQLSLAAAVDYQRTFAVTFPEGPTRTVAADAEGVYPVPLPLPAEAAGWAIHEVQLTVSGKIPPGRVLPPDAPALSADADLLLDADHALTVGLPQGPLARLGSLTAVRLVAGAGADGAELAGTLVADASGAPGEPLPKAPALGPVTIPAGDGSQLGWITLPLAKPLQLTPGERLWVSLQLARGSLTWPLAVPAGAAADAPLRRRLPSGAYRELSSASGVATSSGALRVAGVPPADAPVDALEVGLAGRSETVGFTPTEGGVTAAMRFATPVTAAANPGAFDGSGALQLRLVAAAVAQLTVSAVRVAYTDAGGSS